MRERGKGSEKGRESQAFLAPNDLPGFHLPDGVCGTSRECHSHCPSGLTLSLSSHPLEVRK